MIISQKHMEFATIDRLAEMLKEGHEKFGLTHAYALFVPVLCWTLQKLRSASFQNSALMKKLQEESAIVAPWSAPVDTFQEFNTLRFLEALRNAVAHGDDRRVAPVNHDLLLIAYRISCNERRDQKDRKKITWEGEIVLDREGMRRIGLALAERYRNAFKADPASGQYFVEDARSIKEAA